MRSPRIWPYQAFGNFSRSLPVAASSAPVALGAAAYALSSCRRSTKFLVWRPILFPEIIGRHRTKSEGLRRVTQRKEPAMIYRIAIGLAFAVGALATDDLAQPESK